MSFALAHKIAIKGEVIKWDDWATEETSDLTLRIKSQEEE